VAILRTASVGCIAFGGASGREQSANAKFVRLPESDLDCVLRASCVPNDPQVF
jgi:hypothetical protein